MSQLSEFEILHLAHSLHWGPQSGGLQAGVLQSVQPPILDFATHLHWGLQSGILQSRAGGFGTGDVIPPVGSYNLGFYSLGLPI